MSEKERKDIGAIWVKKTKKGDTMLSIVIGKGEDKIQVIAFKNEYKREGKMDPDFRIFPSRPVEKKDDGDVPF